MGYCGGMGYVALELIWRGWSHPSMFLLGGVCFLLLGAAEERLAGQPRLLRALAGTGLVTGAELLSGLVLNVGLGLKVWDYANMPLNLWGQICLPYMGLWLPVSMVGMHLYRRLDRSIQNGTDRTGPCRSGVVYGTTGRWRQAVQ